MSNLLRFTYSYDKPFKQTTYYDYCYENGSLVIYEYDYNDNDNDNQNATILFDANNLVIPDYNFFLDTDDE